MSADVGISFHAMWMLLPGERMADFVTMTPNAAFYVHTSHDRILYGTAGQL